MPARRAVLLTPSVSSRPAHLHSSGQSAYESPQIPFFVFKRLRTLSFSVSRKSCVCHSYENCRVCTNNSHSGSPRAICAKGACGSSRIARKQLKFFLFKFLRTLLHAPKCQRLCFQAIPHSLHKTPGVGGTSSQGTAEFCLSLLCFPLATFARNLALSRLRLPPPTCNPSTFQPFFPLLLSFPLSSEVSLCRPQP